MAAAHGWLHASLQYQYNSSELTWQASERAQAAAASSSWPQLMCQHVCWVAYTDSRVVVGALLTLPACLVLQVSALQGEQRSLMTALEAVEAALHDARQVRCIWGACVSACRVAAFFGGRNGSAGVRHQPQVCVCI